MKKLLVIDGNSILNRAFYGVKLLSNRNGLYTNAIFGMINILMRQVEAIKPDYAAVAFDLKAPTFCSIPHIRPRRRYLILKKAIR